jgi:peroxiredoxin
VSRSWNAVLGYAAVVAVASCAAAELPAGARVGDKAPAFRAQLLEAPSGATSGEFDSSKATKVTAYVFVGVQCPATQANAGRMRGAVKTYGAKGVDFVFLYPNQTDSSDAKVAFHRKQGFGAPMVDDQGGKIAKLFGARNTTETVICAKDGTIVYRGGLDDRGFVEKALDEHLAGQAVTKSRADVRA